MGAWNIAASLLTVFDWLGRTDTEVDGVNSRFIYSSTIGITTKEGNDNISCEPDSNGGFVRESGTALDLNETSS